MLHAYLTFAFAFVILKVINSEIIVFRFALISVAHGTILDIHDTVLVTHYIYQISLSEENVGVPRASIRSTACQ